MNLMASARAPSLREALPEGSFEGQSASIRSSTAQEDLSLTFGKAPAFSDQAKHAFVAFEPAYDRLAERLGVGLKDR